MQVAGCGWCWSLAGSQRRSGVAWSGALNSDGALAGGTLGHWGIWASRLAGDTQQDLLKPCSPAGPQVNACNGRLVKTPVFHGAHPACLDSALLRVGGSPDKVIIIPFHFPHIGRSHRGTGSFSQGASQRVSQTAVWWQDNAALFAPAGTNTVTATREVRWQPGTYENWPVPWAHATGGARVGSCADKRRQMTYGALEVCPLGGLWSVTAAACRPHRDGQGVVYSVLAVTLSP